MISYKHILYLTPILYVYIAAITLISIFFIYVSLIYYILLLIIFFELHTVFFMLIFAEPLANHKLTKKIQEKLKSKKVKIVRGIKAAQKAILKKEKGFLVLAGDISPSDLVTHFPALAEEYEIPYVFVESSEMLKDSNQYKKPTAVVFMKGKIEKIIQKYNEIIIK